jgi:hypothetical protein
VSQPCHECASPAEPGCSFEDPTGKKPAIPLCRKCWEWAESLVKILEGAPEFQERRLTRLERI